MLARPLVGAGKPRPGWLGAVLERVEIEGGGEGEGANRVADADEGTGAVTSDDAGHGARATEHDDDGDQAEKRAWVWIDGRRHALRRAVDAHGRIALVVDGVARDLFHIVDAWAGAMLAGHGAHAAVVFCGDAGRRRDRAPSSIIVGGFGWDGAVQAADGAGVPSLDPVGVDFAAVATITDHDGRCAGPAVPPIREIHGDRPVLRSTSVGPPPGATPRCRGLLRGAGGGTPFGALAPHVGRAWHRPGWRASLEFKRSRGACPAFGGTIAALLAA